jgi:hypothetical protein
LGVGLRIGAAGEGDDVGDALNSLGAGSLGSAVLGEAAEIGVAMAAGAGVFRSPPDRWW